MTFTMAQVERSFTTSSVVHTPQTTPNNHSNDLSLQAKRDNHKNASPVTKDPVEKHKVTYSEGSNYYVWAAQGQQPPLKSLAVVIQSSSLKNRDPGTSLAYLE